MLFDVFVILKAFLMLVVFQYSRAENGYGFIPIAEYGADFGQGSRKVKAKKAVRLLYSGRNHYDLLV